MRAFLLAILLALTASVATGQPDPNDSSLRDSMTLRRLSEAAIIYSQKHDGQMPPDMASMLDYFTNEQPDASRTQVMKDHFIAPGIAAPTVPADAKPEWLNEHSSYTYLGSAGIKYESVPDWGDIVLAHLKLDAGHPSPAAPNDPDKEMFTLTFVDGHTELTTRAEATRLIDQSRKIFDAIRTGGPLPDYHQATWDLTRIVEAITAYAKDHKGQLPPDLGATLPYVPIDKQRLVTPAQRAGIFLLPAARRNTHIPDQPTPEWINRNTSYVYLGASKAETDTPLLRDRIEEAWRTVLVHGKLDAAISVERRGGREEKLIPIGSVRGAVTADELEFAQAQIAESKKVIDAVRTGSPLPDYQHTLHDLRLLHKALLAFAAANNGHLPPDLGATIPFLPEDELPTLADKARVYLSPRSERIVHLPDELTQEWVNKNANYVYVAAGDKPLLLSKLRQDGMPAAILLHTPLDETYNMLVAGAFGRPSTIPVVAIAIPWGVQYSMPDQVEEELATSRKTIEAARAK
jgi:hypothetical protein